MSPRDPQGAETRSETKTEWRPVCRRMVNAGRTLHEWYPSTEATEDEARAVAKEVRDNFGWDAFAIEKVETTTQVTRIPCAGEEQ